MKDLNLGEILYNHPSIFLLVGIVLLYSYHIKIFSEDLFPLNYFVALGGAMYIALSILMIYANALKNEKIEIELDVLYGLKEILERESEIIDLEGD